MIPYEVDPSLHTSAPARALLDDGFSAPEAIEGPAGTAAEPRSKAAGLAEHATETPG